MPPVTAKTLQNRHVDSQNYLDVKMDPKISEFRDFSIELKAFECKNEKFFARFSQRVVLFEPGKTNVELLKCQFNLDPKNQTSPSQSWSHIGETAQRPISDFQNILDRFKQNYFAVSKTRLDDNIPQLRIAPHNPPRQPAATERHELPDTENVSQQEFTW